MEQNHITALRLKDVRKKRGFTQNHVAEELGVSRSTVASWETGSREPNAMELLSFCRVFGVSFDYMCGRTDDIVIPKRPSVFNIDLNSLNHIGQRLLYEFYRFLQQDDTFSK